MKRVIRRNTKHRSKNWRTILLGILTLGSILIAILLFFTNEQQNEQILNSYCGDFGFGGKSITLMKNGSFRFTYNGCSQSNGYVSGDWNLSGDRLKLFPVKPDKLLDSNYKLVDDRLIGSTLQDEEFILCEHYIDPW